MNHISAFDALVLTLQVFAKIAYNFWPVVVLGAVLCFFIAREESKKGHRRDYRDLDAE